MADGHNSREPSRITRTTTLKIGRHKEPVQLTTAPLKDSYDVLLGLPWLQDHDPAISWSGKELLLRYGGRCIVVPSVKLGELNKEAARSNGSPVKKPAIQLVSVQKMANELKCKGTEALLYVVREVKNENHAQEPEDPQLMEVLREFNDVIVEELPAGLPPRRVIDHRIELISENQTPPHRPCYKMSLLELMESRKQVEDYLQKGYIRPSLSPYGAPILFARKKNGKLRTHVYWL